MLRRGSAQLLLLFFRSRLRLGWKIGAIAGVLVAVGLLQTGDDFPLLNRTGLAQLLRQSAWQHAFAGLPEQAPWPWAETSPGMAAGVPQLGLSASVIKEESPGKDEGAAVSPASGEDPHVPRTKLSEVGVGDRITVTTADGSSRVYRITGRRVVDPHLAETESGPSRRRLARHLPAARPAPGELAQARYPSDNNRSSGGTRPEARAETLGKTPVWLYYRRFFFLGGGAGAGAGVGVVASAAAGAPASGCAPAAGAPAAGAAVPVGAAWPGGKAAPCGAAPS